MDKEHHHIIEYTVDGKPQKTTETELTPDQILAKAEIDPKTHYLVEIKGREKISFQGKTEPIKLHDGMKFISVSTHPTPVSR
jgi:hypothetical protein